MSPMDSRRYPAGWRELSLRIRLGRAQGRCECEGECGLHRTNPGPRRCTEQHGQKATWAKGIVILTVAHLCRDASCADESHLKAMCQRCHLRYDREQHAENSSRTRDRKRGQERFEFTIQAGGKGP